MLHYYEIHSYLQRSWISDNFNQPPLLITFVNSSGKKENENIKFDMPQCEDRALVLFHHENIGVLPNVDQCPNKAEKWK